MAQVTIRRQDGTVERVPIGKTPEITLPMSPDQEIIAFKCEPRTLVYSSRTTEDWHWTAWVASRSS